MDSSPTQLRTVATAMMVVALLVEITGVALLATGRSTSSALILMGAGMLLIMLGLVVLSTSRR